MTSQVVSITNCKEEWSNVAHNISYCLVQFLLFAFFNFGKLPFNVRVFCSSPEKRKLVSLSGLFFPQKLYYNTDKGILDSLPLIGNFLVFQYSLLFFQQRRGNLPTIANYFIIVWTVQNEICVEAINVKEYVAKLLWFIMWYIT